jgi:hypothetical protein
MLADRLKALGEMEALSGLIQELGTPEQKVFFLVEQGEFDGAIALVQKLFSLLPGLMIQFADTLLIAVPEEALQYVLTEVAIARDQTMVTKLIVNKGVADLEDEEISPSTEKSF